MTFLNDIKSNARITVHLILRELDALKSKSTTSQFVDKNESRIGHVIFNKRFIKISIKEIFQLTIKNIFGLIILKIIFCIQHTAWELFPAKE